MDDVLVKSFEFPEITVSYKKYFINSGIQNPSFHYYLRIFNGNPLAPAVLFKGEGAAGLFYVGKIHKALKNLFSGHVKIENFHSCNTLFRKHRKFSIFESPKE